MERSNTKNWMLPKQVKLKRKSVECHSSAQWIDLSIRSNVLGPPKKPFRRICNSHSMKTDAVKVHSEDALGVVSSTSSPEDEYLTHSGHELLAIESSEQYSRSTEAAFDHISDSSSLPTSQQTMEDLEVEKFTVEVTLLHDMDLPRNPSKDTSTIEYINQLKHDRSEAPYVSLMSKFPRETQLNGGVLERLHKLHRRLNSERSIWLHQRELRRGDAIETRKSKLFRVDSSNDVKSVGLPGVVSFRATVLERPFESTDLTVKVSGTRITDRKNTVILALPISGAKFQGASFSRASESDLTILLGDLIKPGDVLRIFSPWSCIPNEGSTQPPLFHSFFWVERVRDRDLPTWYTASNLPTSSSPVSSPISVACSCLASGSKFSVTTCSKRFRDSRDVYADPVETIMPQNLNMNCIFVVHCFQFWILKKVRPVLLVQFHSGGSGLILLPYPVPSRNSTSPAQPTRSWTEPRVGGVYHAQDLLQLPVSHLPKK
ncbi:hypothetical protein FGIG_11697 [Fasciola gigantica]|uniref:Uncharacterized protein n=1 Tax=Fasciola gigantica TaxID=46835 RepID=A0A504YI83_FASGI|nr:hypothetical protein FGIG_11697 [Fasciola gigantica]